MSSRGNDEKEEMDSMEGFRISNDSSSDPYDSGDDALLPRFEANIAGCSDFIPGMVSATLPPVDEKYLDNSGSYYTSSFKARPQAENFDFAEEYKYKPGVNNRQIIDIEEGFGTQDTDERACEVGPETEHKDLLENMVDTCKVAFQDMISNIDRALLKQIGYETTDVKETPNKTNKNLWEIVELITTTLNNNKPSLSLTPRVVSDNLPKLSINNDPCARLPNFGVVLIKSPASISQLWDEYTKRPSDWAITDLLTFILQQQGSQDIELVVKRQTSIQNLEAQLGSSWRNFDKNFSRQINRRKKIWRAIEEGLVDGIPLQVCFAILEKHVKERGSGLSWYYNGVPFKLIDMRDTV